MAIQQKFSFPAACLVFAIIGVALGLTVARDGKLAGFVVGIAVIFAYYIAAVPGGVAGQGLSDPGRVRALGAEPHAGPFGIPALIWRAAPGRRADSPSSVDCHTCDCQPGRSARPACQRRRPKRAAAAPDAARQARRGRHPAPPVARRRRTSSTATSAGSTCASPAFRSWRCSASSTSPPSSTSPTRCSRARRRPRWSGSCSAT